MLYRFCILVLFCGIKNPMGLLAQCGQWQSVPSGTTELLRAVHFPNTQNGWAVGSGDVLLRSADGGATWVSQSAAVGAGTTALYGVHFANGTVGWIVGAGGLVKKTTNGGGAWSAQTVNTATDLYDVFFSDANNGWIAGACGLILRTTNGGADLLNNQIVSDTFYQPAQPLPAGKTIYARIVPYNAAGGASGCQEFSFTTSAACPPVTTTADSGPGSFREAIDCARSNPGRDTIHFALSGNGPHVIALQSPIYAGTDTAGLVIDATTQPGWQAGHVVMDGSAATNAPDGLVIFENYKDLEIYGLTFRNAPTGMLGLTRCRNTRIGAPGKGNIFYGNEDGVPANGPLANPGSYASNLQLFGCVDALVQANIFGLTENNSKPARNMVYGLTASGENLRIGGRRSAGEGNVFAYALQAGLGIWADSAVPLVTREVRIYGNDFGTDAAGNANWGNYSGFEFGTTTTGSVMQTVYVGGNEADFANLLKYNTRALGEYGTALKQVQLGINVMACNGSAVSLCCNPARPVSISVATTQAVAGVASPGDSVAVYITQNADCPNVSACQGTVWLGNTAANAAGNWSLPEPFAKPLAVGDRVTAIGTGAGQSGAFSTCAVVESPNTCRLSDSLELVKLYWATDGPNWTNKWDLNTPMNTWYGIRTNAQGCVTCIDLDGIADCRTIINNTKGNNLTGPIPDLDLPFLSSLHLTYNKISGSLPDFCCLPNLRYLFISQNQLTGPIPDFNYLPSLLAFDAHGNKLSGSIPDFSKLPALGALGISDQFLSGNIPDFSNLPNLNTFYCRNNLITGDIPDFSDNCPKLAAFWYYKNKLTFSNILSTFNANSDLVFANSSASIPIYAPQDSIFRDTTLSLLAGQALTIDLGIDDTVSTNVYYWFKNSQPYDTIVGSNKLIFTGLSVADAGEYRCQVKNPNAPLLTLYGRAVKLTICGSAYNVQIGGPSALCNNQSVTLDAGPYSTYAWSNGASTQRISTGNGHRHRCRRLYRYRLCSGFGPKRP